MPLTELTYQLIYSHFTTSNERECIIMIPITEKEEEKLDNGFLVTHRNGLTFTIEKTNVICYGEIDLNTSSDDFDVIQGMNWLDTVQGLGVIIPANYDYKEHCCYSPYKFYTQYDTSNPALVAQYFHARLGKPKRCCIFKEKKYGVKRIK